jgi:nitrite reductase/ring-hydroxylating ferredoxin subunit
MDGDSRAIVDDLVACPGHCCAASDAVEVGRTVWAAPFPVTLLRSSSQKVTREKACYRRGLILPRAGGYFTREIAVLDTSVLVVRDSDNTIRAFHNICPHRSNKLMWRDDPFQETEGTAPLLYCRFHGWQFNLDGSLKKPSRRDLLLDFDPDNCAVPSIQCDT